MRRFFTTQELIPGAALQLEAAVAHHAVRVLRMAVGEQLELAHAGRVHVATITALAPLTVTVGADVTQPVELAVAVHLVCGIGKGDKAEWIVQKATELGAHSITFANSQWATAKWRPEKVDKKLARLTAIIAGAAAQSHRNVQPEVAFTPDLAGVSLRGTGLIAYEESAKGGEAATLVTTLQQSPKDLTVVFGPEGGLAPAEVTQLEAAGFVPAGLGPRIMRTETAPLYLLSAVSALTELTGVSAPTKGKDLTDAKHAQLGPE